MGTGVGKKLGRLLEAESPGFEPLVPVAFDRLARSLRIGDVLLVEGGRGSRLRSSI